MTKYRHTYGVYFSVVSEHADPLDVSEEELARAYRDAHSGDPMTEIAVPYETEEEEEEEDNAEGNQANQ
jgi:hypothetical protein